MFSPALWRLPRLSHVPVLGFIFGCALSAFGADEVATVYLLGDCARLEYPAIPARGVGEPFHYETARVPGSKTPEEAQNSRQILAFLQQQRKNQPPDAQVILLSCGTEDIKSAPGDNAPTVAPGEYETNLHAIVNEAKMMSLEVVWINLPPQAEATGSRVNRTDASANGMIDRYNAIAARVMELEGVPVIDFHAFCQTLPPTSYADREHFTAGAQRRQADFIVDALGHWWTACARSNQRVIREKLWDGPPPDYTYSGPEGINGRARINHVALPEIVRFSPATSRSGTALVYFPGGGYSYLGFSYNARELAKWLAPYGIAVIGVKYRTGRPPEIPLLDAARAVRFVRAHAAAWGIDPHRIGIAGESAGAHLALNLAGHFSRGDPDAADPVEQQSSRPDFIAVFSSWNFGSNESPFIFPPDTPPFFLGHAENDRAYPLAVTILGQLRAAGIPTESLILKTGGHGAFEFSSEKTGRGWPDDLVRWLQQRGFWTERSSQ